MTGHVHPAPAPSPEGARKAPAARLLVTLALAGAGSGLLVVSVYRITLPAVERYAGQRVEAAVREVLKAPVRWDTLYLVNGALTGVAAAGTNPRELPRAYLGRDGAGKPLGAAITAQEPGFQEEVQLMVGFDPASGSLTGIKLLEQKETPGLGDKIEDSSFTGQFAGRVAPLRGVKGAAGSDPGSVQTITGATISSRAVIRIVNHALERWRPLLQAYLQHAAQ